MNNRSGLRKGELVARVYDVSDRKFVFCNLYDAAGDIVLDYRDKVAVAVAALDRAKIKDGDFRQSIRCGAEFIVGVGRAREDSSFAYFVNTIHRDAH